MRRVLAVFLGLLPVCVHGAIVARTVTFGEVFERIDGDSVNNIDLDGDGTRDFFTSTAQGMLTIVPTGNNRVLSVDAVPPDLGWSILPMTGGELIGDLSVILGRGNWRGQEDNLGGVHNGGAFIYQCSGRVEPGTLPLCTSTIPDGSEVRYVGLELERDGEIRFGWVGISVLGLNSSHWIDVNAWAYETEPSTAIAAGAIPEPAAGILLMAGVFLGLTRRRRSRLGTRVPCSR